MTNKYYNHNDPFTPGTTVRSDAANSKFNGVTSGFEVVEQDTSRSVRLPVGSSAEITSNAAARAGKVIAFDANGNVQLQAGVGQWRNDYATATQYEPRDVFRDAAGVIGRGNLYIVITAFVSSNLTADAAKYELLLDVAEVEAFRDQAAASQTAAASSASTAQTARDTTLGYRDTTLTYKNAAETARDAAQLAETNAAASAQSASDDAVATAADRVQTGLDLSATDADTIATAADRVQTGLDVTSTGNNVTYSEQWATHPEDTLIPAAAGGNGTTDYSSLHHAAKALASETAALAAQGSAEAARDTTLGYRDTTLTYRNDAQTANSNAQTAATNAQTAEFNINIYWLQAQTSDPTLDLNGNPVIAGARYYNTVSSQLRVYTGSAWINDPIYTPAQILAELLTVDGVDSGLDADLLDGLQAAAFAQLAVQANFTNGLSFTRAISIVGTDLDTLETAGFYDGNNLTNSPDGSVDWFYVNVYRHQNTNGYIMQEATGLTTAKGTKKFWRTKDGTSWSAWRTIWHSADQGSGSGLDADTTDGYHVWVGSQASYDAIGTKDSSTLYFIQE